MASRLKSGRFIGAATSESARRQLMQPVPCWEKVWVVPEDAAPGSTLKVLRWMKTDKKQQFSDDEDTVDEPLAPLPDEPLQDEEDDEEKDQDDNADSGAPASRDVSEPVTAQPSVAPDDVETEPKPHPLSISLIPDSEAPTNAEIVDDGTLDSSLNPSLAVPASLSGVGVGEQLDGTIDGIDMRQFAAGVEAFDPNAVEDQVMQDALQNGMPEILGK
ncbi:hypothetical protein JB92DRAFT_2847392 [Gautieria morchelliformis]|nr:hypothetical protein JB92DRAFT_2847392 [Gautieria morchelliformis]